jgi:hypothetical protein
MVQQWNKVSSPPCIGTHVEEFGKKILCEQVAARAGATLLRFETPGYRKAEIRLALGSIAGQEAEQ